ASGAQLVQLWNVQAGALLATFEDQRSMAGIGGVAFSHAGHLLASTDLDADAIVVRDAVSGTVVARLAGLGRGKNQGTFSPDGSLLAACTPLQAGVWDVRAGRHIAAESMNGRGSVAFSPDGEILALGTTDRVRLRVVDRRAGALQRAQVADLR